MDFVRVVEHRRMCRHFLEAPLEEGLLDRLLDLAGRAPSAGHTQGWAWLVLEDPTDRRRFWQASGDPERVPAGVAGAPAIVVPMGSRAAYEERYSREDKTAFAWDVPYWMVDTAMATMILLLGAEEAGLGALLFRLHRPAEDLRRAFGIPPAWEPIGAVALGRPAEAAPDRPVRRRRPLAQVVHRRAW